MPQNSVEKLEKIHGSGPSDWRNVGAVGEQNKNIGMRPVCDDGGSIYIYKY